MKLIMETSFSKKINEPTFFFKKKNGNYHYRLATSHHSLNPHTKTLNKIYRKGIVSVVSKVVGANSSFPSFLTLLGLLLHIKPMVTDPFCVLLESTKNRGGSLFSSLSLLQSTISPIIKPRFL